MKYEDVTFVIRTKNEGAYLQKTLDLISKLQYPGNVEVVIVDSGSDDNTLEIAKRNDARIINIDSNRWSWGRSLNLGIENANGSCIVIISAHCYITSDTFLTESVNLLTNHDAVYGIQLPIKCVDPFEEFELFEWYPDIQYLKIGHESLRGVSNACCVLKKNAWEQIKFDEEAQSMEDGIWAYNASKKGLRLAYSSRFGVYHSHEFKPSNIYRRWYSRTLEGLFFGNLINSNNFYYFLKYYIKRNLITLFVCKNFLNDLMRSVLMLKSISARIKHIDLIRFLIVKHSSIYFAHKDFYKKEKKNYWDVAIPNWLNKIVSKISFDVNGY